MTSDPGSADSGPASPGRDGSPAERHPLAAAALLVLAVVLAYWPVFSAQFVWDDFDFIVHNDTLRSAEGLARLWLEPGAVTQYYPLVFSSLWIEFQLWGLEPRGYHVTNVLLHAANAVLLWRILARLGLPAAWLAAAAFALHPVHVESVAWITERKNVLSGLFSLTSALVYLRFDARRGPRTYALALLAFACALLSKTVAATLPCALLLILWWQRGRVTRSDVLPLLPFLGLGAGLAATTLWLEKFHVGAVGTVWELGLAERCLIAGRAVWFYAGKLVWPGELMFIYPQWSIDATAPAQWLWGIAALSVVGVLFAGRRRWGRGPVTAVLFFGGTLVPALGFFDVYFMLYSWVADHFQYMASVGLVALGVCGAVHLSRRRPVSHGLQRGVVLLLCAAVVVLALRTRSQTHIYHDSETLWRDTVAHNPEAWMAHNNLGSVLLRRGEHDAALAHFERAVALHPGDPESTNNLAAAYHGKGRLDRALVHYREAIEADPEYVPARQNLARAVAAFEKLAPTDPRLAPAYEALGIASEAQQRDAIALTFYERALSLRPDRPEPRERIAVLHARAGRLDRAAREYEALCGLYARRGESSRAQAHCRRAKALDAIVDTRTPEAAEP